MALELQSGDQLRTRITVSAPSHVGKVLVWVPSVVHPKPIKCCGWAASVMRARTSAINICGVPPLDPSGLLTDNFSCGRYHVALFVAVLPIAKKNYAHFMPRLPGP